MAEVVTPEAFTEWGDLHKKADEAWALVGQSAEDWQAKRIDGDEWRERIVRHEAAVRDLGVWRERHIDRLFGATPHATAGGLRGC